MRFCPPEFTDADLIRGGIRFGRSRFRASQRGGAAPSKGRPEPGSGRGNGLWAICDMIEQLKGSHVRIVSGQGEVIYPGGRAVQKLDYANPFCGTLIEWNLKLPARSSSEGRPQ